MWKVQETVVEKIVVRASVNRQHFFQAHPAPVYSLVFHPNVDKCMITASRTIKVWNYAASQQLLSIPSHAHHATCIEIWAALKSVSATLFVGNLEGLIVIWSLELTPKSDQVSLSIMSCSPT